LEMRSSWWLYWLGCQNKRSQSATGDQ